jgi:hypothetical protein
MSCAFVHHAAPRISLHLPTHARQEWTPGECQRNKRKDDTVRSSFPGSFHYLGYGLWNSRRGRYDENCRQNTDCQRKYARELRRSYVVASLEYSLPRLFWMLCSRSAGGGVTDSVNFGPPFATTNAKTGSSLVPRVTLSLNRSASRAHAAATTQLILPLRRCAMAT